jgi:SAM-dependent MidA family methyltransferase
MLEALRLRAAGRAALTFAEFMDVALYDPALGYYRKGGPRIGYGPGTDFLTATASAPLFGRLVA